MSDLAPAHRPTCRHCGRKFRLFQVHTTENGRPMPTRGHTVHAMDPTGYFCTQRCSTKYAVIAVRARCRQED